MLRRFVPIVLVLGCERTPAPESAVPPSSSDAPPASAPSVAADVPIHVESVKLEDARLAFVLRGAKGDGLGVFLHGLCGHGMGYLQSFQFAAAKRGTWVAPHGDVACGGEFRSWSGKLPEMQTQIERAFRRAGIQREIRDVTLVGYSLGATLALALARKHPEVYARLILIAAPTTPSPHGLSNLSRAVMMSGTRDRQDLMKAGSRAFTNAGIPSTFLSLPEASHGQMGTSPERSMDQALSWLEQGARR